MAELKYNNTTDPLGLIMHMAQGYSFESYGAVRKDPNGNDKPVGRSTLYEWVKTYRDFREAKEIGEAKSLYHFEKLLQMSSIGIKKMMIDGKEKKVSTNYKSIIFALKTRFHKVYGERLKHDVDNKTALETVDMNEVSRLLLEVREEREARKLLDNDKK